MAITITAEQRNALYSRIVDQLSAFDDLLQALHEGDLETAYRMGRLFSDGLRLIQEELGWGDECRHPVTLGNILDHELRAILRRIHGEAIHQYEWERPEQEEFRTQWDETALVRDTCAQVLSSLEQAREE